MIRTDNCLELTSPSLRIPSAEFAHLHLLRFADEGESINSNLD
jgi:hypothetical protein